MPMLTENTASKRELEQNWASLTQLLLLTINFLARWGKSQLENVAMV